MERDENTPAFYEDAEWEGERVIYNFPVKIYPLPIILSKKKYIE